MLNLFFCVGIVLDWSSLSVIDHSSPYVSLLFVFAALIFDTIFCFCLALYINAINPGKFGAAKSPFFICKVYHSRNMVLFAN